MPASARPQASQTAQQISEGIWQTYGPVPLSVLLQMSMREEGMSYNAAQPLHMLVGAYISQGKLNESYSKAVDDIPIVNCVVIHYVIRLYAMMRYKPGNGRYVDESHLYHAGEWLGGCNGSVGTRSRPETLRNIS